MSLERNSSLGSDTSLPFPPTVNFVQPRDRHSLDGSCTNMVAAEGGEKEEELDSITDVPTHSSVLRNSMRPLSPFRRHSWGPGKNATNEAEINQRRSVWNCFHLLFTHSCILFCFLSFILSMIEQKPEDVTCGYWFFTHRGEDNLLMYVWLGGGVLN